MNAFQKHFLDTALQEVGTQAHPTPGTTTDEIDIDVATFYLLVFCHDWIDRNFINGEPNEAEQRRGIDTLVRMAWQTPSGQDKPLDVRLEQPLWLQASNTDFRVGNTAIPDLTVIGTHPVVYWSSLSAYRFLPPVTLLQGTWRDHLLRSISTPFLSGEYKAAGNEKNIQRLHYDLSTTLHQQRSLGMPPYEAVGFTSSNGTLRMYSMHFCERTVINKPIFIFQTHHEAVFDLRKPIALLRCYLFFRRLRDHILHNAYARFSSLSLHHLADSLTNSLPWRSKPRPSKPHRSYSAVSTIPKSNEPGSSAGIPESEDNQLGPSASGPHGDDTHNDGRQTQRQTPQPNLQRPRDPDSNEEHPTMKRRKFEDGEGSAPQENYGYEENSDFVGEDYPSDGNLGIPHCVSDSRWGEQRVKWEAEKQDVESQLGRSSPLTEEALHKISQATFPRKRASG